LVVYEEWHVKIIMPLDGVFLAIDVKTKQDYYISKPENCKRSGKIEKKEHITKAIKPIGTYRLIFSFA